MIMIVTSMGTAIQAIDSVIMLLFIGFVISIKHYVVRRWRSKMTDQEKLEFLSKALEENGWEKTHFFIAGKKDQVLSDHIRWSKAGVLITIVKNEKTKDINVNTYINRWRISALPLMEYEVFSDHMEFTAFGIDAMVRFTDGYVLMEYEPSEPEKPEVESVTDTFTNNLSD